MREMLHESRQLPYAVALLYVTLGDQERAIDWIDSGLAQTGGGPWFRAVNPPFDLVRKWLIRSPYSPQRERQRV